ncbi:MAG: DoxX family protein [Clostridiales bacterium]|nr:DoxX family protein [Clostridiales bacterium]
MSDDKTKAALTGWQLWAVWVLRILIGGVFVTSGLAKVVDLWGTLFKIEDYLAVWHIDVPRTLIMVGALMLATFEFCAGLLLALGCYRRVVTWALASCMLFMLPLTAYIWFADPVEDCGCFGDMFILSNALTFWKNVALTAGIVFLVMYNHRVDTLIKAPIQWVVALSMLFYCFMVALVGYTIQPMIDFRPFKVGRPLLSQGDMAIGSHDAMRFIYSRDGEEVEFAGDNLPDEEDGWEYVGHTGGEVEDSADDQLALFDPETGEDVTEDYLSDADSLMLLVITELPRADLSYTYLINEINETVENHNGRMVGLIAAQKRGIERWLDYSMASYPCLSAEDTQLKELSRGVMSMVWVTNDTIRWKRSVSSLTNAEVQAVVNGSRSVDDLKVDVNSLFVKFTAGLAIIILLVYLMQTAILQFVKKAREKRCTGRKS